MTEKRFSFNWERGHPNFWDNYCDLADCYLTCEDVVELLNEQHEQIERLKRNFKALDEVKCEIADENEQLKQFKNTVFDLIDKEIKETKEIFEEKNS